MASDKVEHVSGEIEVNARLHTAGIPVKRKGGRWGEGREGLDKCILWTW